MYKEKETLIFGIRAVIEAIDSDKSLNRVFVQRGLNNKNGFELIISGDLIHISKRSKY